VSTLNLDSGQTNSTHAQCGREEDGVSIAEPPPHGLLSLHNASIPLVLLYSRADSFIAMVTLLDFRIWSRLRPVTPAESRPPHFLPILGITAILVSSSKPFSLPFLWMPLQVEKLGFCELATARMARRDKHPVSMDAADTGSTTPKDSNIPQLCSLLCRATSSLLFVFSVSHLIAFYSGKNGGKILVSSSVSWHPAVSCLCQSTYTSVSRPCSISLSSAFALSNFALPPFCVHHVCSFIPFHFFACRVTNLQVTLL
jgi:hypothetical protein